MWEREDWGFLFVCFSDVFFLGGKELYENTKTDFKELSHEKRNMNIECVKSTFGNFQFLLEYSKNNSRENKKFKKGYI